MYLETERFILRPWREDDAENLYEYAKDVQVGPIAGWPPHTSVENSREIIQKVLSAKGTYAIILKHEQKAVGSIGLMDKTQSNLNISDREAEIGYWIGVPFWGQGLVPEAVRELQRFAFEELDMTALWCGYFDGNEKSKRVQEKCGFTYHHTIEKMDWKPINKTVTEHITRITKEEWQNSLLKSQTRTIAF